MDSCSKSVPIKEGPARVHDPFSLYNHIRITELYEDGTAVGELTVHPESLNPYGIVHGGCLATLADTVGGTGVFTATGKPCVTVNYAFSFLRPALGSNKKLYCKAVPEKLGHRLCVYRQTITDDNGVEVANGNFTFYLMDHAGEKPPVQPAEP
ncbi:PaaI family thioesterase [Intestinimonas timonensis]|uniref:PaaI family thioesterase n=1 Tax=Intestinimonas timonensis TaxID=1689270 RepID=UPI003A8E4252